MSLLEKQHGRQPGYVVKVDGAYLPGVFANEQTACDSVDAEVEGGAVVAEVRKIIDGRVEASAIYKRQRDDNDEDGERVELPQMNFSSPLSRPSSLAERGS